MTPTTARTVANLVLAAAGAAAVYYVVRTPALRRAAWRLTRAALTRGVPVFMATEVRRAWTRSGRAA